mgnify:CR=1 FL=1
MYVIGEFVMSNATDPASTQPIVEIREAVRRATEFVAQLYGPSVAADPFLEEIQRSNGGWDVTISFTAPAEVVEAPNSAMSSMAALLASAQSIKTSRVYKELHVRADGEVESMRIRRVA